MHNDTPKPKPVASKVIFVSPNIDPQYIFNAAFGKLAPQRAIPFRTALVKGLDRLPMVTTPGGRADLWLRVVTIGQPWCRKVGGFAKSEILLDSQPIFVLRCARCAYVFPQVRGADLIQIIRNRWLTSSIAHSSMRSSKSAILRRPAPSDKRASVIS